MSAKAPLNVVIYWHMHQPEYRDAHTGSYYLPWTYLHVIKDYVDMAAHLENNPDAKAVVNFTPTLLEQIDDYANQFAGYMKEGTAFRDPMLEALVSPIQPESQEERLLQIEHCLRANEERLVKRYPQYERLAHLAKHLKEHPDGVMYIHDQYLADILVWFHLAWLGETVRRNDLRVKRLIAKGEGFTLHERIELAHVMGELTSDVIKRYRTLAEKGRVELSVTPYAHPIVPLLLDINSAREAIPDIVLPNLEHYPDGEQRSRWHIEKGIEVFQQHFGFKPAGCWPSEGSVSEATVRLLGEHGFQWYASGETVLRNSLSKSDTSTDEENECIHRCYQFENAPYGFFRDDGLSDLIGFTYSDWHADDAAANMVHHLENIAEACQEVEDNIVSIILDGENAWEFYPENGYHFLTSLYKSLAEHPDFNLTTYSDYLKGKPQARPLEHIVAGSWVYGTFSTWIGDKDKNHAWDMLGEAKKVFDRVMQSGSLDEQHKANAEMQMAICEGSDWFWWFGDYNPAESVSDFDHLYRTQLTNLYLILGVEPPENLTKSFSHGSGTPAMAGTMRRGQEN
jgi:alpha-amylase/alpha-mannosidase (GH57 family)